MMSEGADWLHMGKSPCVLLDFGRDSGSLLLVEISDVMDGYVVSYPYLSSLPNDEADGIFLSPFPGGGVFFPPCLATLYQISRWDSQSLKWSKRMSRTFSWIVI
jgi:hypothetical protein